MRVLVMGGTRFNGLALVHELVKHGHDVTVFNRGKSEAALPRRVKRLVGDRHDHEALRATLGASTFDCVQDISAYTPDDVKSMATILRGRVGHYIFASSTVMYARCPLPPMTEDHPVDKSERQSEYGMNKILCEEMLVREHREHGFPATMVPFSMVFGPHNILPDREQRMFTRLLSGRPILVPGDGKTLGQVGHVEDEARALRMMMGNPTTFGKRYNLTGKDYFSDEGYVDTFAEVTGREPRKVHVPAPLMDDIATDSGWSRHLIQRLAPNIHPWNESALVSTERLTADIGWRPEYTFRAAVEQTFEWFTGAGAAATREFDFTPEDAILARIDAA